MVMLNTNFQIMYNNFNNLVDVKFVWQISYPAVNGASLGSFLFIYLLDANTEENLMTDV